MLVEQSPLLNELNTHGLVIMRNVLPLSLVNELAKAAATAYTQLKASYPNQLAQIDPELASADHQMLLCPLTQPFISPELILATKLTNLTQAYLGKSYYLQEITVNIALAGGTKAQKIHTDQSADQRGAVGLVWNVALATTNQANGVTRFWQGSVGAKAALETELNQKYQPFQPTLMPGDVLVRDSSILHQGVANRSTTDRLLLTLVFKPGWQKGAKPARGILPVAEVARLNPAQHSLLRHQAVSLVPLACAEPYPIELEVLDAN